jgi:hypothetical protein
MKHLSRRGLLKAALAASGSRLAGPWIGEAMAAGERSHFVHIFFNGGLNALFAGCADRFVTNNVFGVGTDGGKVRDVGDGVFTDLDTFGRLPRFALDHWGAIGMRHNNSLHTTPQNLRSGGERAILINNEGCYLNQLAYHMGGDSAFKAVYFGDRAPAYQNQPAYKGVPLQRVSDLKNALSAAGGEKVDPDAPERAASADSLETANTLSDRQIATNPERLSSLRDAYGSAVASLSKPLPPPVTFAEINKAYDLGGKSAVTGFASSLAGAEIMIRAAGTNVVHVCDNGLASWDFHQLSGGRSQNGALSREKLKATGVFKAGANRIEPILTFVSRMLEMPDRNVVICISGELVRLPNGDHGDGTVAMLFGKHVKRGLSFPVDSKARFAPTTPGPKAFWAAVAQAVRIAGQPFGSNPHPLVT